MLDSPCLSEEEPSFKTRTWNASLNPSKRSLQTDCLMNTLKSCWKILVVNFPPFSPSWSHGVSMWLQTCGCERSLVSGGDESGSTESCLHFRWYIFSPWCAWHILICVLLCTIYVHAQAKILFWAIYFAFYFQCVCRIFLVILIKPLQSAFVSTGNLLPPTLWIKIVLKMTNAD